MLLQLDSIQKRFGGVVALRNGQMSVRPGEVHLLLGENGAGKSTLMKIVAGMHQPDSGAILWKGQRVSFRSPAEAARVGIAMVHQESLLAPHLSVAENIFLGREERLPLGWVSRRRMLEAARRLIADHHFPLQAEWRVGQLSPAGKQLVEICRAIQHGSSLLIFDEPTSSLSETETQEVFRIVRTLKERQMGVIYITHRLEELRAVGDRVTVLRDGETVHTSLLSEVTTHQIIQHMVGRELSGLYQRTPAPAGEILLQLQGLSRKPVLKNISLTVRAGEVVGLAGLIGAGRTELCRAIFGLDPVESGKIFIRGQAVRIASPREAVTQDLALIPEDRQRAGLATALPLGHNITIADLKKISRLGFFLDHDAERRLTEHYVAKLRIRCSSVRQLAGRLSGGNQQKVVIAKWLLRGAKVFLFDEPTRGIDIGAKVEVYEVIDELARAGAAILMVSSELPELLQVADRILVMRQGEITGELTRGTTQEEIMRLATLPQGGATMEGDRE
ncbi:MAG: sugar ABC transporter ATP-binding protein [Bryobacteraceae bacterium]|nr:sugar ABC transporter ATP-binding protein [Bryobacteraceae bacterium]MDW8376613.1 sugar ABC transporter ATP-binding protein [Bryobacterales bacterium]